MGNTKSYHTNREKRDGVEEEPIDIIYYEPNKRRDTIHSTLIILGLSIFAIVKLKKISKKC